MITESCLIVSDTTGKTYEITVWLNKADEVCPVVISTPVITQRMSKSEFKTLLKCLIKFDEKL